MIRLTTRSVYACKCDYPDCGHEWDALSKPKRCAGCKRRRWNSEDRRLPDPFQKVSPRSKIRPDHKIPEQPSYKGMLDTFRQARRILQMTVEDNPCDHQRGICVCEDKRVIENIDRYIRKLAVFQNAHQQRVAERSGSGEEALETMATVSTSASA